LPFQVGIRIIIVGSIPKKDQSREPLNKPLSALVYQRNSYLRRGFAGITGYVKKSQQ